MESFILIFSVALWAKFMCAVSAQKLLHLDCQVENLGVQGQDSLLKCMVKSKDENVKLISVAWRRSEVNSPLLWVTYDDKPEVKQTEPRFSPAQSQLSSSNMDVSFLIRNTQRTDEGKYECSVVTDSGIDQATVSLNVIASYSKPTMSSVPEKDILDGMEITLFCNATGGYPVGMIHWFDQYGTNWTRSTVMAVKETADKRINLSSKFSLKASSSSPLYRCIVLNNKGVNEGEEEFELAFQVKGIEPRKEEEEKKTTAYTAIGVVAGSLLCGLLVLAVVRQRRIRQSRRPSTYPILSECPAMYEDPVEVSAALKTDTASESQPSPV